MKASIVTLEAEGRTFVLATGYAEERRDSTTINKTSALENCETSAIGRALAAYGYAGTEYASADEVAQAVRQQSDPAFHTAYIEDIPRVNPATAIKQEHFSGSSATFVTEDQLKQLNFLPKNLKLSDDTKKQIWDSFYQKGVRRGKFDQTTMSYPNIELRVKDVPSIVAAFGVAAGKTPESIDAMTKQITGDLNVDTPTDMDDYSDEPF
jgi:hypothetical protein